MNRAVAFAFLLLIAGVLLAQDDAMESWYYADGMNFANPLLMPDGVTPIPDGCLVEIVLPATSGEMNLYNDFHGTQLHNAWSTAHTNGVEYLDAPGYFLLDGFIWESPEGSPEEPVANCAYDGTAADQVYLRIYDAPSIGGATHFRTSGFLTGPESNAALETEVIDWGEWQVMPVIPHDRPDLATPLTLPVDGETYNIATETSALWYVFEATEGTNLSIFTTLPANSDLDPELYLYGPCSQDGSDVDSLTWVANDDDSYVGVQSLIEYTVPTTGFYFLRASNYENDPSSRALTGAFNLFIRTGTATHAAPTQLQGFVANMNDVSLIWQAPVTARAATRNSGRRDAQRLNVVNYNVYRDGVLLGTVNTPSYTDNDLADGSYTYTVTAYYNDWQESAASNPVTMNILTETYLVPVNFTVALSSYTTAHLDWDAPAGARPISGYHIYRNGAPYISVGLNPTSFNDTNLIPGTYTYSITSIYNTTSESAHTADASVTVETITAPTSLTAVANVDDVHLAWTLPARVESRSNEVSRQQDTRVLEQCRVYRNGTVIATVNSPNSTYDDLNLTEGAYSYTVTAVYTNTMESAASNSAAVTIDLPNHYLAPTNLTASVINDYNVQLDWHAPGYLYWDSGSAVNAIGSDQAFDVMGASRWTVSDLLPYLGSSLTQVSFIPADANCTYSIMVWTGGSLSGTTYNAGTLVVNQTVTNPTVNAWNNVTLTTPVSVQSNQEIWFGVHYVSNGGTPGACDDGPAVHGKGNLFYIDGAWTELSTDDPELDYNWSIHGKLVFSDARETELSAMRMPEPTATSTLTLCNVMESPRHPLPDRSLSNYSVYRNGTLIGTATGDVTTWTQPNVAPGTHNYYLLANYTAPNGTSDASNTATVTVVAVNYLPPTNLAASVEGHNIQLAWTAPDYLANDSRSVDRTDESARILLSGYKVYREGALIATIDDPTAISYQDADLDFGSYSYWVTALYNENTVESDPSEIVDVTIVANSDETGAPLATRLGAISPNPFNPETRIDYSVKNAGHVELVVLNLRGQEIATLVNDTKAPGTYHVNWNGTDKTGRSVPSGVYFAKMKSDKTYTSTKKMILLK
jgi:fibronectin type 3 domain-containing protein